MLLPARSRYVVCENEAKGRILTKWLPRKSIRVKLLRWSRGPKSVMLLKLAKTDSNQVNSLILGGKELRPSSDKLSEGARLDLTSSTRRSASASELDRIWGELRVSCDVSSTGARGLTAGDVIGASGARRWILRLMNSCVCWSRFFGEIGLSDICVPECREWIW
jgi:hypothetical protein